MVQINIRGVNIEFPHNPYDCQMAFMDKVIQSLEMSCDAALESPTGTGKTLSLLCATLAYTQRLNATTIPTAQDAIRMDNESRNKHGSVKIVTDSNPLATKVYYCSRTHSQLAQVVRELNKTMYKVVPTSLLASRDQLCLHDKVKKEPDTQMKAIMCNSMVSKRTCHFYNKWDGFDTSLLNEQYITEPGKALDIEDLVSIAKSHGHCPFYRSRQMNESAKLILLPYNYLLDPELRKRNKVDLKGSIVIFDEAHNLESICEDMLSVDITSTQVALAIKELQKAIENLREKQELIREEMDNTEMAFGSGIEKTEKVVPPAFEIDKAAFVLQLLFNLETLIDELYLQNGICFPNIPGKLFPGEKLQDLLNKAGFSYENAQEVSELLQKTSSFLNDEVETTSFIASRGLNLLQLEKFFAGVFLSHSGVCHVSDHAVQKAERAQPEHIRKHFKLWVTRDAVESGDKDACVIKLNYWCFTAGIAMNSLKTSGVRTIIVTSGTLSPMNLFIHNMGIDFGCTLENAHAAKSNQVMAAIVPNGPGGELLNGSYKMRESVAYGIGIGESLLSLAKTVPQGILVFFSSYSLMFDMIKTFKKPQEEEGFFGGISVWEKLSKLKTLVVEPKDKARLNAVRLEFTRGVREAQGSIFFAVCRGKVSEGIDFADADARAVCIVGIPYPPLADPRVNVKKSFITERNATNKGKKTDMVTADVWYSTDGYRAVNQAIGRVLRHIDDFGIIVLLDNRFAYAPQTVFPSWMRSSLKNFPKFADFKTAATTFFTDRKFEIKASIEKQNILQQTEPGRAVKKEKSRVAVQTEMDMNFDIYAKITEPVILPKPEVKKRAPGLANLLNDAEDEGDLFSTAHKPGLVKIQKPLRTTQIPYSTAPGASSIPAAPPRKKLKIVRDGNLFGRVDNDRNLQKIDDRVPTTSDKTNEIKPAPARTELRETLATKESLSQPTSTRLSDDLLRSLPPGYREALSVPMLDVRNLLAEGGVWKNVKKLLKASEKEDSQVRERLLRKELIPGHAKAYIALIASFPDAEALIRRAVERGIVI